MGGRTEHDRGYGYWFPLVLLGFGLLVLLANDNLRTQDGFGWFAYTPSGPGGATQFTAVLEPGAQYYNTPLPYYVGISTRDWTWTALVLVTLVGAVAWYAVRARRAGRSVRGHVAMAVGGVVAVLACHVVAGLADAVPEKGEMVRSVALPLTGLGVLAGAYYWFGPRRRAAAVVSVVCLTVGASALMGAWAYGLVDPLLITCGLLVLAGYERSRLVAVLAVVLLAALLVFPFGILSTLVPAVVVLAAAVAALVRRSGRPAPA
jgi:hypothetical protein